MNNIMVPEPWLSFLTEVDRSLDSDVVFHCFGGFAITLLYGLPRATEDVDIVGAMVREGRDQLLSIAGKGSPLHVKHRLYLDLVGTIAVIPDEYESRLILIEYGSFHHIKLFAMEPHDIILTKLGRDAPKDIHDVMYLAKVTKIDTDPLTLAVQHRTISLRHRPTRPRSPKTRLLDRNDRRNLAQEL